MHQTFVDTYNLPDVGTSSEPHSFPVLDDASASRLDPLAEPNVLLSIPGLRGQTRSITNHLGEVVLLLGPLELAHDREKRARDGERGRLDVRQDVGLMESLEHCGCRDRALTKVG